MTPLPLAPTIDMGQVISIGLNASIASNANTTLNFGNLTTVGKSITVINNTDCTIDLDRLIRVGNLSILDNINTTLPTFPALERAENIHLRGYINTSTEHNIFPALLRATGTVFIEPWNDFNCSKLVSQQQNGIIASLICDGTDNSTLTATAQPNVTPSAPPARLSKGAWAGIGIGIGVFTIGSIIAIACCTMYLRRLLKDVQLVKVLRANLNSPQEGPHQQHVEGWHEADGQGILREKPDDHIREIYAPPVEMLDDQVPAVQSSPVELPGGSPISQRLAVTK
ncbi:hypothetical protein F4821DRAFT_280149 [Hypoxylon rubiginosum]|uniref:Uncharacterized protein n=1 Tax=Hypoxylon rubiginosum TaxID=110542 RepID=A0ACC0DGX3_9PEZI|nr:hypothetical protein F4821DRAFT_280149 [Hypoxylon rubiginosum]